jgi:chemotaxis-related protein WspB
MVQSRPVPASQPWMTGVFDFRGQLLPLLDASRLLGNSGTEIRMSSRIIVIRTVEEADESRDRIGLIVEHVLGSESIDFGIDSERCSSSYSSCDFLGPITRTGDSLVQLTHAERLPTLTNEMDR